MSFGLMTTIRFFSKEPRDVSTTNCSHNGHVSPNSSDTSSNQHRQFHGKVATRECCRNLLCMENSKATRIRILSQATVLMCKFPSSSIVIHRSKGSTSSATAPPTEQPTLHVHQTDRRWIDGWIDGWTDRWRHGMAWRERE